MSLLRFIFKEKGKYRCRRCLRMSYKYRVSNSRAASDTSKLGTVNDRQEVVIAVMKIDENIMYLLKHNVLLTFQATDLLEACLKRKDLSKENRRKKCKPPLAALEDKRRPNLPKGDMAAPPWLLNTVFEHPGIPLETSALEST